MNKEEQQCEHEWKIVGSADQHYNSRIGFTCICKKCGKYSKMMYEYIGMYEEVYGEEY